jgi:hypothetical protein
MANNEATVNAPDIKVINLAQLFSGDEGTFKVPDYQREYSWSEEQIKALFEDLTEFQKELENGGNSHYLLGQAIFSSNPDSSTGYNLFVVDGQQRLTSLYLFAIVLHRWLSYHSNPQDQAVLNRLHQVIYHTDLATGSNSPRIGVAYGGDEFVTKLLEDHELPQVTTNKTQENIKENYSLLFELVQQNFGDDKPGLLDFIDSYLHKVWIVVVTLENDSLALAIFDKINSRGLPLSNAELLKVMVFRKASDSQYQQITNEWNAAAEATFKVRPMKAASMQFLMKSLLGQRLGVGVSNNKIAEEWGAQFKTTNEDMLTFAKTVKEDAVFLSRLGSPVINKTNEYLNAAKYFKTVQHLPVALAARKFSTAPTYEMFAKFLDARLLLSTLARERGQTFDSKVWPWVKNLSSLSIDATEAQVLAAGEGSLSEVELLFAMAKSSLEALDYRKPRDNKLIRFIFAICNRMAEHEADENSVDFEISNFLARTSYDLDHIFPKSLVESADFDLTNGKDWVHKIGNLTFLHSGDNKSLGAANAGEKSIAYSSAKLILTNSLAKTSDLRKNPRVTSVISNLHGQGFQQVSSSWGYHEVVAQTEAYWNLISKYIRDGLQLDNR